VSPQRTQRSPESFGQNEHNSQNGFFPIANSVGSLLAEGNEDTESFRTPNQNLCFLRCLLFTFFRTPAVVQGRSLESDRAWRLDSWKESLFPSLGFCKNRWPAVNWHPKSSETYTDLTSYVVIHLTRDGYE